MRFILRNIWNRVSHIGVWEDKNDEDVKVHILLNRTAFLLGIFAFIQSIFNLYLNLYIESAIIFIYMLFYIFLLTLSYKKFLLQAKFLLTIGTNVIIILQSFLLGWEAGFHYFLIPGTIIFLLFFKIKSNKVIFNILILIFIFITIYLYKYNIVYYYINKEIKELLYISSFISSVILNYLFYYYLIYNNEEYRVNQLLEKLEKDELLEALKENVNKTKNILDSTPEGFILIKESIIHDANDSMAKILGSTKKEIIGKNIYLFLDDVGEVIFQENIKKSKNGIKISHEISFIRESGEKIPCLMHSTPTTTENSSTSEIFSMVTDISEMKYFQRELVIAMKQAGEATKAKSSFLANMSHEIRTPMNAIIGLSSLALKTNLDFKQKDYIEKVNNAGVSLLGIINDILDFSKIESGKFEIEKSDFNIDKVLDNVFSVVIHKVAEKNLDLNILLPKELPLGLVGDPLRLGQILINLVNNAVKFTEKGYIDIRLEIISSTEQNIKIRFSVVDTGIGISKEGLNKLFKPFSQTDSSISRKFGGTGLGLSISKNLVELMNGKIWAESDFGVGSRFIFEMDFLISTKIINESEINKDTRRLNILILEKNKEFYDIISNYLQYLPVNIDQEDSLGKIVELVSTNQRNEKNYNLLIISTDFSEKEIRDLVFKINALQNIDEDIKIILKTDAKYGEEIKYKSYSADGILTKPINKYLLINTIYNIFSLNPERNLNLEDSRDKNNLTGIRILLAEDNVINQQVATEVLRNVGAEVEVANNGVEVIQMLNLSIQHPYDIILMDIQMPELDGLEATSRILEDERLRFIPILAMTAHALKEEIEECLKVGMKDFIAKPIDPDKLFETILKWVDKDKIKKMKEIDRKIKDNNEIEIFNPEKSLPEIFGLNVGAGLRRLGGNIGLYNSILRQFQESIQSSEKIVNEFYQKGDYEGIRKYAHSTKGSAGNIGHDLIFKSASELEKDIKANNLENISEKIDIFLKSIVNFEKEMQEKYSSV